MIPEEDVSLNISIIEEKEKDKDKDKEKDKEKERPSQNEYENQSKKEDEKLILLIEKKSDTQNRMHSLRYDPTIDHADKEMDLKKFADDITSLETKIIEQLKKSTDNFVNVLKLDSVGMENLFEERKKQTKPRISRLQISPSPSSKGGDDVLRSPSTREGLLTSPSGRVMSPRDTGLFKSPSGRTNDGIFVSPSGRSSSRRGGHSGLNSLVKLISDFFSSEEEKEFVATKNSDLNALEQEIACLRASIFSLEQKKNLTKQQIRSLDDLRDQLKLRTVQREKLSREEYMAEEMKN